MTNGAHVGGKISGGAGRSGLQPLEEIKGQTLVRFPPRIRTVNGKGNFPPEASSPDQSNPLNVNPVFMDYEPKNNRTPNKKLSK